VVPQLRQCSRVTASSLAQTGHVEITSCGICLSNLYYRVDSHVVVLLFHFVKYGFTFPTM
jgi:hypothetical protein